MRAGEIKRMIGYYEPKYDQFCGNCTNCKRKGTHLRCSRFKIAVQALGMCHNGWDGPSKPLTAKEAPLLLGYDPAVDSVVHDAERDGVHDAERDSGEVVA